MDLFDFYWQDWRGKKKKKSDGTLRRVCAIMYLNICCHLLAIFFLLIITLWRKFPWNDTWKNIKRKLFYSHCTSSKSQNLKRQRTSLVELTGGSLRSGRCPTSPETAWMKRNRGQCVVLSRNSRVNYCKVCFCAEDVTVVYNPKRWKMCLGCLKLYFDTWQNFN